jgi:hypothetical protein
MAKPWGTIPEPLLRKEAAEKEAAKKEVAEKEATENPVAMVILIMSYFYF